MQAEFDFDEISLGSDRELLLPGAMFIWLIGQEVEHGSVKNMTKFVFRRMRVVRGRMLQEAKDNAEELAKLFSGINV